MCTGVQSCFAKTCFHWFIPILRQIVKSFAFFVILGTFFACIFIFGLFYWWILWLKPVIERSMGQKCVLGCTYVLQRFVSIVFFQFCNKWWLIWHFVIFGPFFALSFFWTFIPIHIMIKPNLRGLWDINVYWGALMFCKDSFPFFSPNFATNSYKFGIFYSFWGLLFPDFLFLDLYTNKYYG